MHIIIAIKSNNQNILAIIAKFEAVPHVFVCEIAAINCKYVKRRAAAICPTMCTNKEESMAVESKFFDFFSPIITLEELPQPLTTERIDNAEWICAYSHDIFQTWCESEQLRRKVSFRSKQIDHRAPLLTLLKEATQALGLARTTLHFAIYLLDIFMDAYVLRVENLKLVAITCLMLAAKSEDVYIPRFWELNQMVGSLYTITEFRNLEFKLVCSFDFEFVRPTVATFAEYLANSIVTLDDYHVYLRNWLAGILHYDHQLPFDQKLIMPMYACYEEMATYLCKFLFILVDVTLNYMKFTNERPSIIAAACVAAVRSMQQIKPKWTAFLMQKTMYTEEDIEPFIDPIIELYKTDANNAFIRPLMAAIGPLPEGVAPVAAMTSPPEPLATSQPAVILAATPEADPSEADASVNMLSDSSDSGFASGGTLSDISSNDIDSEDETTSMSQAALSKKCRVN